MQYRIEYTYTYEIDDLPTVKDAMHAAREHANWLFRDQAHITVHAQQIPWEAPWERGKAAYTTRIKRVES